MPPPSSHGSQTRRQVYQGSRPIRGLFQRQLADGSVVYEARLRDRTRVRLDAKTKTDAIREAEALRTDRDRGVPVQTSSLVPTVSEVAADYLDHLDSRIGHRDPAKRFSPRTVALYRGRLNDQILPAIGHLRIDEVDVSALRRMIDQLGRRYAPGTVTSIINITSGLLRFAVRNRYAARNVVRDLDRDDRPGSKRKTEPRYLSADEVERLLAAMGGTYRPVAAACAYAGLRISEALGLRWADVDLDAGTLRVQRQLDDDLSLRPDTKTPASTATVRMLPVLVRELRSWRTRQAASELRHGRSRSDLVFTTMRGKPQSRRNALRAVHNAGDAAGLNPPGAERVGLHDLRHSFVGLALANGLTMVEAAELARHANPGVTATMYAGLSEADRAGITRKLLDSGFGR